FHDALRAGGGDFEHFARLAASMLGEREFFIRKAIGWVLRSVASKRPALVARFVAEHLESLSGLTYREATRALPAAQRTKLAAQRTNAARSPGRLARPAPSRASRARRAPA
ncbi:MAG TPA: DNA alkylation repair protein, partial [Polyangiaceae bacterium]|nr:DNA alkylation repair protein [Polyangiaceae bacterium]